MGGTALGESTNTRAEHITPLSCWQPWMTYVACMLGWVSTTWRGWQQGACADPLRLVFMSQALVSWGTVSQGWSDLRDARSH